MLAHRAMAQGELVAEIIAGKKRSFDKICAPAVCYTDPEIVSVGIRRGCAGIGYSDQNRLVSVCSQRSRHDHRIRGGFFGCWHV
jgi:pyruvate/2-oxoglutarate dehydrogenase complex dihydrolipoamide dehydrogenase (E3) component